MLIETIPIDPVGRATEYISALIQHGYRIPFLESDLSDVEKVDLSKFLRGKRISPSLLQAIAPDGISRLHLPAHVVWEIERRVIHQTIHLPGILVTRQGNYRPYPVHRNLPEQASEKTVPLLSLVQWLNENSQSKDITAIIGLYLSPKILGREDYLLSSSINYYLGLKHRINSGIHYFDYLTFLSPDQDPQELVYPLPVFIKEIFDIDHREVSPLEIARFFLENNLSQKIIVWPRIRGKGLGLLADFYNTRLIFDLATAGIESTMSLKFYKGIYIPVPVGS